MLKLHDLVVDFIVYNIFMPVSGDRLAIVAGGLPPSSTYTILVYQQCWCRIFLPRHAPLKQARSIIGDGFKILKHIFFGGLFLKLWTLPFFPVGSVKLVTCFQLLSGRYGTVPYGTVPYSSKMKTAIMNCNYDSSYGTDPVFVF